MLILAKVRLNFPSSAKVPRKIPAYLCTFSKTISEAVSLTEGQQAIGPPPQMVPQQ
jgi:hypothetical protein